MAATVYERDNCGVSVQIFINLGKTFLRISLMKNCTGLNLGEGLHVVIFLILDFLY